MTTLERAAQLARAKHSLGLHGEARLLEELIRLARRRVVSSELKVTTPGAITGAEFIDRCRRAFQAPGPSRTPEDWITLP